MDAVLRYASVGVRFVAVVIDTVILLAIGWLIALATGDTTATGYELEGEPAILLFAFWFAYYIVLEKAIGGTVGKRLIGLRVQKDDGTPLDWGASIVRNVLRIVDFLPFGYIVGAVLVSASSKRQRLGDRVGETVVMRSRVRG